ncbi:MAG: CehA/McbA family metallohydrolase [Eubacteriales bacterium]|nr:CehA/McbA family metallohydrolase [Eubacteriales bacterium]
MRRRDEAMETENRQLTWERFVTKQEEGQYFPVEFLVPEGIRELEIWYEYERFAEWTDGVKSVRVEKNIVDFALCAAQEKYLGSSGSDRSCIRISACESSQGFAASEIVPGTWKIILGAYKISEEGCAVRYTVTFFPKQLSIYRGDTHLHTTGSDGCLTADEVAWTAKKEGLDYVFVTDHNNYAHNGQWKRQKGMTVLPGAEWTHYRGHAGMLGVNQPFENPFCVNRPEEMREKLAEAGERGALVVLNHPFCPNCGWRWGMESAPYDLIEIWNGACPDRVNRRCLEWWDRQLKEGKRIPVIGGSDFHRTEYGRMIGSPCTCLYALSESPGDLLEAMKRGHAYVTYAPEGPMVWAEAGGCLPGDEISESEQIRLRFEKLKKGDRIVLITDLGEETIELSEQIQSYVCTRKAKGISYLRAELYRAVPGLDDMPAMLTNPFYVRRETGDDSKNHIGV